ncbi:hypothetical protein ANCCAN_27709, partial [Ancylostoma caninum]
MVSAITDLHSMQYSREPHPRTNSTIWDRPRLQHLLQHLVEVVQDQVDTGIPLLQGAGRLLDSWTTWRLPCTSIESHVDKSKLLEQR